MIVYWAPWNNPIKIHEDHLAFQNPEKLLTNLNAQVNYENKHDNFFKCPAFINSIKNTFVFNNPKAANLTIHNDRIDDNGSLKTGFDWDNFSIKQPSYNNAHTVHLNADYIFFSEESLHIHSTPPYLHNSSIHKSGFYVPGTFDISQWFRPLEHAFQMWPGQNTFQIKEGEPLMYVNFLTEQPIVLKRFYLTEELWKMSISCVRLKYYKDEKNLTNLYKIFKASGLRKKVLQDIKLNLLEDES